MADAVQLRARKISAGKVAGEALVTSQSVPWFNAAHSDDTGVVRKHGHELEGVSTADRILVFDTDIGSTGGSIGIYNKKKNGVAPKALIYRKVHAISASGAIFSGIPAVEYAEADEMPWDRIRTGDWVVVDADNGTITVERRGSA